MSTKLSTPSAPTKIPAEGGKPLNVVRLRRTAWNDHKGVYLRLELKYLRKQSSGFNLVGNDCESVGAHEVLSHLTNLHSCKDGVYRVIACNLKHDCETGEVEDWDYCLVPHTSQT